MAKYTVRFKDARLAKKLKQSDIAALLGVTTRHYQEIEYGKIVPSATVLIAIAEFYNVSIDYLVGRTDNPKIYR